MNFCVSRQAWKVSWWKGYLGQHHHKIKYPLENPKFLIYQLVLPQKKSFRWNIKTNWGNSRGKKKERKLNFGVLFFCFTFQTLLQKSTKRFPFQVYFNNYLSFFFAMFVLSQKLLFSVSCFFEEVFCSSPAQKPKTWITFVDIL